jgi:hypothetical protein
LLESFFKLATLPEAKNLSNVRQRDLISVAPKWANGNHFILEENIENDEACWRPQVAEDEALAGITSINLEAESLNTVGGSFIGCVTEEFAGKAPIL